MSQSSRSIEKNRLIIEIAVDAIISISSRGLVETFNPAAEKLFGFSAEEVIGQNINLLMPEPDAGKHDGYLEHYLETRKPKIIGTGRQVQGKKKNGEVFDAFLSVAEMEMEGETSFVGIVRDISHETRAVKNLEASYIELEKKSQLLEQQKKEIQAKSDEILKASQYKSEFLSNMSHELRSPLNSLLILSKMLSANESGNLSDDEVESAKIIHSSGNDLLKLINDILDLSKVEAGKLHLDKQVFSVKDLINILSGQFKQLAENNNVQFSVLIDASVPEKIYTDDHRLMQILKNLTSNAFKFTSEGSVSIRIFLGEDDGLLLSITDTGIGIPENKLSDIFDAFHQVDGTISRKYGGTGLGLSISNALAHLLGGSISVSSEVGHGSTFTLKLPRECLPPSGDELTEKETSIWHAQNMIVSLSNEPSNHEHSDLQQVIEDKNSHQALNGKKILLVDDDLRNSFSLSRVISGKGCRVSIADNGELAMEKLESGEFDLILMDMIMPVMDGYTTIRKIREKSEYQTMPIIALTAKAMPEDKQKCLDAGASDYLAKPVETSKLLDMLNQWLLKTNQL